MSPESSATSPLAPILLALSAVAHAHVSREHYAQSRAAWRAWYAASEDTRPALARSRLHLDASQMHADRAEDCVARAGRAAGALRAEARRRYHEERARLTVRYRGRAALGRPASDVLMAAELACSTPEAYLGRSLPAIERCATRALASADPRVAAAAGALAGLQAGAGCTTWREVRNWSLAGDWALEAGGEGRRPELLGRLLGRWYRACDAAGIGPGSTHE